MPHLANPLSIAMVSPPTFVTSLRKPAAGLMDPWKPAGRCVANQKVVRPKPVHTIRRYFDRTIDLIQHPAATTQSLSQLIDSKDPGVIDREAGRKYDL